MCAELEKGNGSRIESYRLQQTSDHTQMMDECCANDVRGRTTRFPRLGGGVKECPGIAGSGAER
jgi:hypothetical protein